jgi:hypothetical protein
MHIYAKNITVYISLIVSFCFISAAAASTAEFYYSDGPWTGKIIDADTKEPLEGVVVLAYWEKEYRTPAGRNSYFYDTEEVVTGKDGAFFVPKFRALNVLPLIREIEGPYFKIFKPGYAVFPPFGKEAFEKYFPNSPLRVDTDKIAEMFKKGVVIEMPRLKTIKERRETLSLPTSIPDDKMPKLIEQMNKEATTLGLEPTHVKGGSR